MRKLFITLLLAAMCVFASAQTNQMFWFNGQLMFGAAIAQTDSVVFRDDASALDTLHLLLPRTATIVRHDTVYVHVHDTIHVNNCGNTDAEGPGVLSGVFSVGENTQVHFSQGNLQYQASTQTWRFAENQYDLIGSDNSNISASYSGWIDLFGWGTGDNPTNASWEYADYQTYVDWGTNAISNGGNEANLWRTLTTDEWVYLFCTRTNAASLFGLGSVNGINGTIILPDNWVTSEDASFTASATQGLAGLGGYFENYNGDNFSHNTYTEEQWEVMEQRGAVFLPAAGIRGGTNVVNVGSSGSYWSSTPKGTEDAYDLSFNSDYLSSQINNGRYGGRSVRLVR